MARRVQDLIVVLDASILVSAVLKANSIPERAVLHALAPPNIIALSREVEAEYRNVLSCPKFDRIITEERRRTLLDTVILDARRIEPTEAVRECPDPKDNKYLALAAAANAGAIVTGDLRHLLPMHPWRGIPILSPAQFLALS